MIRMVRVKFSQKAGGGQQYYRASEEAVASFRREIADTQRTASLTTENGTIHSFPPGSIREMSDRPYDPTTPKRRR